jgi:hypothetical protein
MMLFIALLVAGIFGIGRLRRQLLGDRPASAADENPAWLQAVIAEHQLANGKAAGTDVSGRRTRAAG